MVGCIKSNEQSICVIVINVCFAYSGGAVYSPALTDFTMMVKVMFSIHFFVFMKKHAPVT